MKNIIFLGAPGCGKGTQASMLSSKMSYIQVSTGDLLREIAKEKTDLGNKTAAILNSGALVSDDLVNQLIEDFYNKNSAAPGVILDGYPRTVEQAKTLELILNSHKCKIDAVFYFNVSEDILVKRITGRYTCANCGAIYNKFFYNTKVSGQCDKCGLKEFKTRGDDTPEIITERLKIFKHSTEALIEYYKDKLIKLDADKVAKDVSEQILEKLS